LGCSAGLKVVREKWPEKRKQLLEASAIPVLNMYFRNVIPVLSCEPQHTNPVVGPTVLRDTTELGASMSI
jgi:hypothetical protein